MYISKSRFESQTSKAVGMDSVYDINITREQNETFGFTVITSEDGGCCIGNIILRLLHTF